MIRLPQFFKFALVGAMGFCIDAGLLTLLNQDGLGLYTARGVSFSVAVLATYALNRRYTFLPAQAATAPGKRSLVAYTFVQVGGALVNLSVFYLLLQLHPGLSEHPVFPLAGGALAGLVFNYSFSRLVFLCLPER